MKKILSISLFALILSFKAFGYDDFKEAQCVIIEEENAIYCKYIHTRVNHDKQVVFNWIEPNGIISRSRVMTIPAGHGSVYDYRFLEGRTKGIWTFEVIDDDESIKTTFEIK
jgi:hypothetical protein